MIIEKAVRKAVAETKKHHAQGFSYRIITDGKNFEVLEFYGDSWATLNDGWRYLLDPREYGNELLKFEKFPGIFQNPIKTTVVQVLECLKEQVTC